MCGSLLPVHFREVIPALMAMFALSMTFSLYNFALFHTVMEMGWNASFIAIVYTAITTLVPKHQHQEASTLSILIYFAGGFLGNSLVGPAMDHISANSFPVITALFIGLMLVGLFVLRKQIGQNESASLVSERVEIQ